MSQTAKSQNTMLQAAMSENTMSQTAMSQNTMLQAAMSENTMSQTAMSQNLTLQAALLLNFKLLISIPVSLTAHHYFSPLQPERVQQCKVMFLELMLTT